MHNIITRTKKISIKQYKRSFLVILTWEVWRRVTYQHDSSAFLYFYCWPFFGREWVKIYVATKYRKLNDAIFYTYTMHSICFFTTDGLNFVPVVFACKLSASPVEMILLTFSGHRSNKKHFL